MEFGAPVVDIGWERNPEAGVWNR